MVYRIANIPLDYSVRFCKVSDKLTIFVVVTGDLFPFKASSGGIVHKFRGFETSNINCIKLHIGEQCHDKKMVLNWVF